MDASDAPDAPRTPAGMAEQLLKQPAIADITFEHWLRGYKGGARGLPKIADSAQEYFLVACDEALDKIMSVLSREERAQISSMGGAEAYDAKLAILKRMRPDSPLCAQLDDKMHRAAEAADLREFATDFLEVLTELKGGKLPCAYHLSVLEFAQKGALHRPLITYPDTRGLHDEIKDAGLIGKEAADLLMRRLGHLVEKVAASVATSAKADKPPPRGGRFEL